MNKRQLISTCLESLHKNRTDSTAVAICECQVNKIDRHFSNQQYKRFNHAGVIDIPGLLDEDSLIKKQIQECYVSSGKTMLLQAEGFENEFMANCIESIQKNTERKLDLSNVNKFCSCQLNLIKAKKLTDKELDALNNTNSLLFYEVMYKCGDPFAEKGSFDNSWKKDSQKDISGPESDTIFALTLNGMTYVKIKTGSLLQFWLFDTGASDLLINNDMEKSLKNEGVLTQGNYLGTGEYEMANGVLDTCRKYLVNNIQIGKFTVNRVVVAVTDKGKRIIVGKALLNKFNNWELSNEKNILILKK